MSLDSAHAVPLLCKLAVCPAHLQAGRPWGCSAVQPKWSRSFCIISRDLGFPALSGSLGPKTLYMWALGSPSCTWQDIDKKSTVMVSAAQASSESVMALPHLWSCVTRQTPSGWQTGTTQALKAKSVLARQPFCTPFGVGRGIHTRRQCAMRNYNTEGPGLHSKDRNDGVRILRIIGVLVAQEVLHNSNSSVLKSEQFLVYLVSR